MIALGVFLSVGAAIGAAPALAQGYGWFGTLFGGKPRATTQPHSTGRDRQADGVQSHPRHRDPSHASREDHAPKNATVFVIVLGDTFGQNLASGLDDALADRQNVAIVHQAKTSTGLVATDVFDWQKAVENILAAAIRAPKSSDGNAANETGDEAVDGAAGKPTDPASSISPAAKAKTQADQEANRVDVAVMMIGSADRQAIHLGGVTLELGTPEWTAEYQRRVLALDEAFLHKGIPLIWVGLPIVRDDAFADDMAAFNDIYREVAAKTGAVFVDTWEAFSDDTGDFSAVGPDIDGRITRLRVADGIYFTKAGSRKLAHFVEAHVRRALDGKMAPPPMPETTTPVVAVRPKPDNGPISSLTEPLLSGGGQLDRAYHVDARVEASIVNGSSQPAPSGRADDLRWPAAGAPSP